MLESHKDVTLNAAILWPAVWLCDIMKKAHISEAMQMEILAHCMIWGLHVSSVLFPFNNSLVSVHFKL